MASYGVNPKSIPPMDIRTVISTYSQFIKSFCKMSSDVLSYWSEHILSSPLVTEEALSTDLLKLQVDNQIDVVQSSGPWLIVSTLNAVRFVGIAETSMNGLGTNLAAYISNHSNSQMASIATIGYDTGTNSSDSICYCAADNVCIMPAAIYINPVMSRFPIYQVFDEKIIIPGLQTSCYPIEGMLASTLECFYNRSCIDLLISNSSTFSLLNASIISQYPPNSTLETIVNELMIEKWSTSVTPISYYTNCDPSVCTYSITTNNGFLVMMTTIIGLIGGLNSMFRLITPYLIEIVMYFINRWSKKRTQPINRTLLVEIPERSSKRNIYNKVTLFCQNQVSLIDRIRVLVSFVWNKIISFNLFDSKSPDHSKQMSERYVTRFYIVTMTIACSILLFYTVFTEKTNTYMVQKPSLTVYEALEKRYPDTIQCPCTQITMPLSKIIYIEATFHQICSTLFILPDFFNQLGSIEFDDPFYRGDFMIGSANFFQSLQSFCWLSRLTVIEEYRDFGISQFVNTKLLSRDSFATQAEILIQSVIDLTVQAFADAVKVIFSFIDTNKILSGSYIAFVINIRGSHAQINPGSVLGCSCLLDARNCSKQAAFYEYHSTNGTFTQAAIVDGVRLGCSPLQSLLHSSLLCWYTTECYERV